MNNESIPSRFPSLSKLTIALIENAAKPILGENAIEILKTPYKQKELAQSLNDILARAEVQFQRECTDDDLRTGLLQLKFSDLPSLQRAFWSFYKSPGQSEFLELLKNTLRNDFTTIPIERIDHAAKIYLRILFNELSTIDRDTREKLITVTTLEIKDGVERIASGVEKIVGLLDSQKQRTNQVIKIPNGLEACIVFTGEHNEDKKLAMAILESLGERKVVAHDFAQDANLGNMEGLLLDIRNCQTLIQIFSAELTYSEIITSLLKHAFNNNVRIIPIRINFPGELTNSIKNFIPNEKFIHWKKESDNPYIIGEITKALAGRPYGQNTIDAWKQDEGNSMPRPYPAANVGSDGVFLEHPRGTMDPESRFYILRPEDHIMQNEMNQNRFIITIKGPRQMGKSSMLVRGCASIESSKKKVVYIDFQRFEKNVLDEPDKFYKILCEILVDKLNISTEVSPYWGKMQFGPLMRCSNFIEKYVLPEAGPGIILAMDEVDIMIDTKGRSDFFGLLRSWYNDRSAVWRKLNMVLVVSTEPLLLIDNLAQSPFNVGTVLNLNDFEATQIWKLNQLHNYPFTENGIRLLMSWIGGHPYLVRQALYMVSAGLYTPERFMSMIHQKDGPYGDHLMRHLLNLIQNQELAKAMRQLVKAQSRPSETDCFRLESAGLVLIDNNLVIPRNNLYKIFMEEHL